MSMEATQVRDDLPTFNFPPVSEGLSDLPRLDDPFDQIRDYDPSMDWEGSSVGQRELALRDGQDTEISEALANADPKVIDGTWTEGVPTDLITESQTDVSAATDMRQFAWAPPITEEAPMPEELPGICHGIMVSGETEEADEVGLTDILLGAAGSLFDKLRGNSDAPTGATQKVVVGGCDPFIKEVPVTEANTAPTWVGAGPTMQERLRPQETAAPTMTPRCVESTPLTPEALPGGDVRETTELIPDGGPLAITDGGEASDVWGRLRDATHRA